MGLLNFFKKKQPQKQIRKSKRNYSGASNKTIYASWLGINSSADAEIQKSLRAIRGRARELVQNNDYAKKFKRMVKTNVIGSKGIILQNRAQDSNGVLDKQANNLIEAQFKDWSKKGVCDVTGKYSLVDLQKIIISNMAIDGEVLIRKVKGYPNAFGYALQIIEADHLDEQFNDKDRNISMSIEFDKWSKPIAYHIFKNHPTTLGGNNERERVKADEIIHLFIPDRVSQTRGVTWLHSAMTRLNMLGGIEEAVLVAKRASASKMGFFTKPAGETYEGDEVDENGTPIQDAEAGHFEMLPDGWDFKAYDPQDSTNNFADFEKAILRGIASGLDVSYNSLANDLEGVSYSSIRAGVLEERDVWKDLQSYMIEHFMTPIYEEWLKMSLLTGAVALPFTKFDKFNNPNWLPRAFAWVDPLKDTTANILAVKEGFKTMAQIASENGQDLEEIYQQLAREKDLREQYKITTLGDAQLLEILSSINGEN